MIADGYTNKAICAGLNMGMRSLRTHLSRMVTKLNLDRTKDVRVQITWLVIDARYEENPDYVAPMPIARERNAA